MSLTKKCVLRRALLRRMAPEHKFATAARLCSEVLAPFAEGALPPGAAVELLRDGLRILASRDRRARRHSDTDIAICSSLVAAPDGAVHRSSSGYWRLMWSVGRAPVKGAEPFASVVLLRGAAAL